jgi:hypothetical protein
MVVLPSGPYRGAWLRMMLEYKMGFVLARGLGVGVRMV